MAAYVWDGSHGTYTHAHHWTPYGVPSTNDVAYIFAGTSHASDTTIATVIIGSENPIHDPELSLNNATMNSLFVSPETTSEILTGTFYADLDIAGTVKFAQHAPEQGPDDLQLGNGPGMNGNLDIRLAENATFDDTGSIFFILPQSTLTIAGAEHSTLINTAHQFEIRGGTVTIDSSIAGTGVLEVSDGLVNGKVTKGSLTIDGSVSSGQTAYVDAFDNGEGNISIGDISAGGRLYLLEPMEFLGTIDENLHGEVVLKDNHETSFSYFNDKLTVYDHQLEIASLNIFTATGGIAVSNVGHDVVITNAAIALTPDNHQPLSAALPGHL
jgi:hypothetical protein